MIINNKLNIIGLGTGIGSYKKKYRYSEVLFRNYIKICKKYQIKFIDTSPVYGDGKSEKLIGKFIKNCREDFFIATKLMPEMCSKDKVKISVMQSLKRLNTSYLDLLQIHWPNEKIPFEETVSAMIELKNKGLIHNIGLCNFSFDQIKKLVKKFKPNTFFSIQTEYNLFERSADKDLLPFCKKNNIFLIAYSPLAQGKLANGKKQIQLLKDLAKKYKCDPSQIVLSWMAQKRNIITIPNSSRVKNLCKNFESKSICLEKKDFIKIDKICITKIKNIDTNEIRVSDKYNRKVYKNVEEAKKNKLNMTPSPLELSKEIKKGNFLKPVRLKKVQKKNKTYYDLTEGRLRYWSWVIAFNNKKPIPSLIWEQ